MTPRPLFEAGMQTGEGPVWDARTRTLWCVDCTNPALWAFDAEGGVRDRMALPARVGFAALTEDPGRLVLGMAGGLFAVEPGPRRLTRLLDPEPDIPGNRINDGTVDLDGGLVFGSLHDAEIEASGLAWHLAPDGRLTRFDEGYVVFNGPCPHPDGARLIVADSVGRRVKAFRRGPGSFESDGDFCAWEADWGLPDGVAADADGGIWIAHWGGAAVTRFDAAGAPTDRIAFPCSQVTKPAFGGEDLTRLYVTTANRGIAPDREPLAGALFAIETGRVGVPAGLCRVRFGGEGGTAEAGGVRRDGR